MSIRKSINYLLLTVSFILLFPQMMHCSAADMTDSGSTDVDKEISEIKSQISQAKNDFVRGSLDWSRYGSAALNIFSSENDMVFVSELIDWLLRDIPDWDVPKRDIQKFMSDTENNPDRSKVRLKLLNLLLIKAAVAEYSRPQFTEFLFDPMPTIRKRMIQVLNDDGTMEAIPAIEKAIDALQKSKPLNGDLSEEINLLQDSIRSIQLWDERSKTQWIPNEEEIRQQSEKILELTLVDFYIDSPAPTSNSDGQRYIIDRWTRFKWGVKRILEDKQIDRGKKNAVIMFVISKVHPKDCDEAFSVFVSFYDSQDHDKWQKWHLMSDILKRASVNDLHRLSKILVSVDPTDVMARQTLINKYGEIGTEECLSVLNNSADFWRDRQQIGWVKTIEEAIQAIEQRLGITPTVNPVHSSE